MTAATEASEAVSMMKEESVEPPHVLPLPPVSLTFDTKALLDTVNWLGDAVQSHHSYMNKLQLKVKTLEDDAKRTAAVSQQKDENAEQRYAMLEKAILQPAVAAPASPVSEDQKGLQRQPTAAIGGGGETEQLVRKLDLEVSNCLLNQKKMEQDMKHQEESQVLRDETQDELLKMELKGLSREISACMKEKDMEAVREMMKIKLERIESEIKGDLLSIGSEVKATLHGQINDVQASVSNITESLDKQLNLLTEKTESMTAEEINRNDALKRADAQLLSQMQTMAQSLGVEVPDIAADDEEGAVVTDRDLPMDAMMGGVTSRDLPMDAMGGGTAKAGKVGGKPMPPKVGSKGGNSAIERLERRLDQLAAELGVTIDADGQVAGSIPENAVSADPDSPKVRPPSRPQPLPTRVEKLEEKQNELTNALQAELGLVLPSDVPPVGSPSPGSKQSPAREASPEVVQRATSTSALSVGEKSVQAEGANTPPGDGEAEAVVVVKAQALRLDAIEAHLKKIGDACGLEPMESFDGVGAEGAPVVAAAASPKSAGMPQRVNLLDAKMNEVATMLGLTPDELEAAAHADERGMLAGRVLLREETEAVSPRLAGMVAGQEDTLISFRNQVDELEGVVTRQIGDVEHRVLDVESKLKAFQAAAASGVPVAAAPVAAAPAQKAAEEAASTPAAKAAAGKAGAKSKAGAKPSGPTGGAGGSGGSGGQDDAYSGADAELVGAIVTEVQELKKAADEARGRITTLTEELEKVKALVWDSGGKKAADTNQAASPSGNQAAAVAAEANAASASAAAMQRAESAAEAANASAAAANRLRQELEEILRAIEVPMAGAGDAAGGISDVDALLQGDLFAMPRADAEERASSRPDQDTAEETHQYVERQMEIDFRLNQLEEQLDAASENPAAQSDMFGGLKVVVKDVRKCLQRCELLFQLPEIKAFVKNFRKSLQMNAILHERWMGPDAVRPPREPREEEPEAGTGEPQTGQALTRGSPATRSAPDLRASKTQKEVPQKISKKGDGKAKKPFRTIVDWTRPHTPLKLDPQFKGHLVPGEIDPNGPSASVAQTAERTPNLPPIGGR